MNIITVIPLSRSKLTGTLSYFTATDVPVGAIVSVPVRSKSVHAIVTGTRPAADMKSELKNADFAIRRLGKVKASMFFPTSFMDACNELADYYATGIGAVIDTLMSGTILEHASEIAPPLPAQATFMSLPSATNGSLDETYAIQGDEADRISSWRSLIRQEFARKKSIALYVPTIEDGRNAFAALEKGIEGYIFLLHSGLSDKKVIETWGQIAETGHPIVVVATGSFSVLPRSDIDTVVIERQNGRGWITPKHPWLDLRHALETIARRRHQTVYLSDCLLSTGALYRVDEHSVATGSPFKWRSVSTARDVLVDMKKGTGSSKAGGRRQEGGEVAASSMSLATADNHQIKNGNGDSPSSGLRAPASDSSPAPFRVLSPELEDLIRYNQEESTHLFILAARRGHSPTVVCNDCQTIVSCHNCSAPVILHTSAAPPAGGGKNFLMCHKCGERRSADEVCAVCGSWNLVPLGIGIDRVRDEIAARFPEADLFKIDADSTKTEKQVSDALERFRSKPGSILLGTELALLHLSGEVDHAAVVSLDSLFALPDYAIQEKVMYALVRLRALARRTILVQTRRAEEKVFEWGLKGNLSDFHRATLNERKRFGYPPYSRLIKVTIEGKKDVIAERMAEVQRLVAPRELDVFPAFTATVRNNSLIHGLIKVELGQWPDNDLLSKLRSLPPNVSVKVDPESLL